MAGGPIRPDGKVAAGLRAHSRLRDVFDEEVDELVATSGTVNLGLWLVLVNESTCWPALEHARDCRSRVVALPQATRNKVIVENVDVGGRVSADVSSRCEVARHRQVSLRVRVDRDR